MVIAAEEDGDGIGRIRMAGVEAATRACVQELVEPGATIHTDGHWGYDGLKDLGYGHEVSVLLGKGPDAAGQLLPRVHLIASLLKRWLLGTHQGAVSLKHLDYYLDEFTFRFNRRKSVSRGKLFYRLLQQAVQVEPATYRSIVDDGGCRSDPTEIL